MERRSFGCLSFLKKKSRGSKNKVSYGEEEPSGSKSTKPSVQEESSSVGSGSTKPSHQMSFGLASVFPYEELKEATNSFDSSRVLGGGGYGRVYSGDLRGRTVAIKKLYDDNPKLLEQFFNEVTVLSRIRHKNLVTLHGCSNPHTRELLLVYEFVSNGTVADHLHGPRPVLTWATRIQIAVETAEALEYLHALEPPIIHREVKTSNILPDNAFHVKVADLGICRLLPWDTTHVSTLPQGTMGYRDPEYERFFKLTDKTDVYSFGVVLLELISGKEAVDVNRAPDNIYLDVMAVDMIINKRLKEFVDPKLGYQSDNDIRRMINSVAELAQQCLLPEGKMRPRMVQVLRVLKEIKDRTQPIHDEDRELEDVGSVARAFSNEEGLRATNSLNPSQDPEHIKDETRDLEGRDRELGEVDVAGGFSEAYTFSHEELDVATNSFDSSRDLEHGRGRVFHGKLKDGRTVVVKKIPERYVYLSAQLSKEVPVISRLRHENLVTLYGCTAPCDLNRFLVYEYAPNCGTLDFHLHGQVPRQPDNEKIENRVALSWSARIQIAIQTAEALSYLHSLEPPILHTDLTTSSILIDDKFHVKVIGLDIFVSLITDKSDVYDFGVVLLELLLGKRVYDKYAGWDKKRLTDIVLNKIQNKELDQLVDVKLDYHSNFQTKRMVTMVSELACRCLQPVGNMRPRMAEVLLFLREIWVAGNR